MRSITRRDFVNGVLVASSGLGVSQCYAPSADAGAAPFTPPPERTGLRGSHPGAFEAAHALRDGTLKVEDIPASGEHYDLIVIGGGLSGLAAAHFFQKYAGKDKTVLIVENHDDFGGHAKRNEFDVDGHKLVLNGGTLELESPSRYNRWAQMILDDMGIDLAAFRQESNPYKNLYAAQGMNAGLFFDKESWEKDVLVSKSPPSKEEWAFLSPESLARAPMTAEARRDVTRLLSETQPDYLAGHSDAQKKRLLATISYKDYLLHHAKVDPSVVWIFQKAGSGVFCVGADALPALFAMNMGYPGFSGLKLPNLPLGLLADLPGGQHGRQIDPESTVHFPDGNATLARLLIASLIPDTTSARTQDEIATATINYAALDRPGQSVRVRLSTLGLHVAHDGAADQAQSVSVICAPAGQPHPSHVTRIQGGQVVMACWNMIIPYVVPSMPEVQKEALSYGVKGPIVYTNVALKNWNAFKALGVSRISCPGMFFEDIELAEPVASGGLKPSTSPDHPIVVRLIKTLGQPGLPKRDQHRAGRAQLLATSFETFEAAIRDQLNRVLGPGGFDADRDIAGITVNRWPHGYAYTYNSLYDPLDWVFTETDRRPCVVGRQPFGRIAVANSDASASPHTDAALQEAHRAVIELLDHEAFPFVSTTSGPSAA